MSRTMDFIVLTKSRKNSEKCVAALSILDKKMYRLVSKGYSHLNVRDLTKGGQEIEPLNMVRYTVSDKLQKNDFHAENLIVESAPAILGTISIEKLLSDYLEGTIDTYQDIFLNNNNKLTQTEARDCPYSLQIVNITDLQFFQSHHSCKCDFMYDGKHYFNFSVTIGNSKSCDVHEFGTKSFTNAIGIFSFSDSPYNLDGFHYKFLANVFIL